MENFWDGFLKQASRKSKPIHPSSFDTPELEKAWLTRMSPPGMVKQTVIINKAFAKGRAKAKALAKPFADRLYTARETGQSYRFRQLHPDKFVPGTFRTFKPTEGVSIVYGQLLDRV